MRALYYGQMSQKVFGIGLSRTGTSSLTHALRILGYRAIHYPLGILIETPTTFALNRAVAERYDALTDLPAALLYTELDASFPGSKFILTVRDTDTWFASMQRLAFSYRLLRYFPKVRRLVRDIFGTDNYNDRLALTKRFEAHTADVTRYFADRPTDLLVINLTADTGWGALCSFLGKPAPPVHFPKHNIGYRTTLANMSDFLRSTLER